MLSHYKAFLVVIVITVLAFWLARPTFTKFMSDEDFVRRRNLWLAVTTSAFLIPSFWLHMAVAGVLIWRVGRRDPNPAALYLFLLMIVPPFQRTIPGFGLANVLFPLDHFRLLALALLVPAALTLRRQNEGGFGNQRAREWRAPDILILLYGLLPVVIAAANVSVTGTLRGVFLVGVDLLLPYFVISRVCSNKQAIVDAIAAFALAAMVLAPLALFESLRGWLLYSDLSDYWGINSNVFGYLLRSDVLRAQVTSGQSIVLGNFYAVALGLWLYLAAQLHGWRKWLGTAAIALGLLTALSRGPWVGGAVCLFVYFAVGPRAVRNVMRLTVVAGLVGAAVLVSPLGPTVIDHLPFIGTVDAGNVGYREALIDRSWLIIKQNPFFGSPYFLSYMEDLRTGQGIIDLLNAYLTIGMAYGLVTLGALLSFFLVVGWDCLRDTRRLVASDPDSAKLGAGLFAALAGTLVTIYTVSNYLSVPYIYLGVCALMVAYSKATRTAETAYPSSVQANQVRPAGFQRT